MPAYFGTAHIAITIHDWCETTRQRKNKNNNEFPRLYIYQFVCTRTIFRCTPVSIPITTTHRYFRWTRLSLQQRRQQKNSVKDWLEGIIRFTFTYTAYILLAFAPLKIYQTTRAPLKFSSQIHFPYTLCASISLSLSISFSHAEHSPLNVHRFHIFNALTWPWLLRIQWEQRSAHTLNVARADPGMSYDSEFHQ